MMQRLLRIAKTEVLEHRRQPAMLSILVFNYLLWGGLFAAAFVFLDVVTAAQDPALEKYLATMGVKFDTVVQLGASTYGSVAFMNLPLFVAYMSGTSVLHDRETGTLPFLMLAPVTRLQLLAGKLAGAMAIPFLLHLVFCGVPTLLLGQLAVLQPVAWKLGGSVAWWIAFLIGAPASAAFVGALGTVISARSTDTRTAVQFTSFFITLLSLVMGSALTDGLSQGVVVQLAYAVTCVAAAAVTLAAGARLISRDVAS